MLIRSLSIAILLGFLTVTFTPLWAQADAANQTDPFAKWESAIEGFEQDDREHPKAKGQILFVGSSSIRLWDLPKWFPNLDAINRGFGGSEIADTLHFYDRIVVPYAPRAIVMYAGDNDLSRKKTPAQVHAAFQEFVSKVHQDFPETSIIYIAVKPSLKRWNLVEQVRATNALIAKQAEADPKLTLLDIDAPMIGVDGTPKPELFAKDGLHLSEAGYQFWTDRLRPHLEMTSKLDARLRPLRDIYNKYHPWTPPTTLQAWESEAAKIQRQILVSNGLWPLPVKTPLEPVIYGKIDRGEYTVEKVFFRSRPGHYVTGNLYRPTRIAGKVPGVLCPHGHWQDGRFYDSKNGAEAQLKSGAEQFTTGAQFPLQARMVQLAKMGCVVFHYDMIGYADNQPLDHRTGFNDAAAAMWLHNIMGLQTWNSIRALDFLESLSEVDSARLAVTGASGGGTQTMLLGAIDPRVDVVFPAVMVSTGMQGGCVCENASYLRQGVNNIAFAALFAPKPQAMSGADDWTIAIETRGLPELKQVYALYGKADNVAAQAFPQFKHNYNQVSREVMFNWFNEHLDLGLAGPIAQTDFEPLTREEMTVFTAEHPLPQDALSAEALRKLMVEEDQQAFNEWLKGDSATYRDLVGGAADVMLQPEIEAVEYEETNTTTADELEISHGVVTHAERVRIPTRIVAPGRADQGTVYWFGAGNGGETLSPEVRRLAAAGYYVVTADLFLTGEDSLPYKINEKYPGYTYCYNHPLITERVRDILAVVAAVPSRGGAESILIGDGPAGVWTLLARSVMPEAAISRTIVDLEGFDFQQIQDIQHPNLLPGALKYGGLAGLARLVGPSRLHLYGVPSLPEFSAILIPNTGNAGGLELHEAQLTPKQFVEQLVDE